MELKARTEWENHYLIECFDKDGNLKWVEEFDNLVTDEGVNDNLDKYLKGFTYSAAFYVGITDGNPPTMAITDTLASKAWTEVTAYSQATRPALTLGTVSAKSVDNSASKAVFSINGTATAGGAFIATDSTKGGTTGVLYGEGAFSTAKAVENGDTLNVTITCTGASA